MTVRAIRGAIQVDADQREAILEGTTELIAEVMSRNELTPDDVISVLFTATPDLTAEFPALAARKTGFHAVPLMCATEIPVTGAMFLRNDTMAYRLVCCPPAFLGLHRHTASIA